MLLLTTTHVLFLSRIQIWASWSAKASQLVEVKSEEGACVSTWWSTIGEVKEVKMMGTTSTGTGMLWHDKGILAGVDR